MPSGFARSIDGSMTPWPCSKPTSEQTTIADLLNDRASPQPGPLCDLPGVLEPLKIDGPVVPIA